MTEFDSFCENGEANCCAVQSQALTPVSAAAFAPAPQNQRAVDPPCGPYGTCRLQKAAVFLGFAQNAPIGTRESTATGKAALVVIISCMLVALIAALSILFMNYRIKQDNAIEGLERFRGASLRNTHVAVPLSDVEDPADLSMGHARPTSTTGSEDTFEDDPLLPRHEAKFVYLPQNPDEILLEVGDIVTILQKQDDSWAICRNLTKKVTGVIPLAYIQPIEAVVEPAPSDNEILETIPLNQEE